MKSNIKKNIISVLFLIILISSSAFAWEIKNYINEFNEPTQSAYITSTKFKATQYNNVTSYDSNAELFFDDNGMYITLWDATELQYLRPQIKKASIDTIYAIEVSDKNGMHYYFGAMGKGEDRIYIGNDSKNEILGMIMTNDIIYFTLRDTYKKPEYNPYDYHSYENMYEDIRIASKIYNYKFSVSQRNLNELFGLK